MKILRNKILLLTATLLPFGLQAQEEATKPVFIDTHLNDFSLYIAVAIVLLLLFVMYHILTLVVYMTAEKSLGKEKAEAYSSLLPTFNFGWNKVSNVLTDAVPIQQESDILLDHDYDGIKELDNHLPPWWKWMFYASIGYAVFYFSYNIIWGVGPTQYEKYDEKVAAMEIQRTAYLANMANNVDENSVVVLTSPNELASGAVIFQEKCATCHGNLGEGKIGPNLTDTYWIHGGEIKDVFKTVKYGVANKMIAWEDQLLPSEISEVSSFVLSMQGSNPPNALGPQGVEYIPVEVPHDSIDVVL